MGESEPKWEIMTKSKRKIMKGLFHSEAITHQREKMGWTQKHLALRIGCGVTTVFNWENGLRVPKRNHLQKLASVFQVSISTFYTEAKDIR